MIEEWRPVVGWEALYSVSSLGRVRRDAPGRNARPGHIRRVSLDKDGYARVSLPKASGQVTRGVHQLVAEAFWGPKPSPLHEPNHKDGVKTNNAASNLEWLTGGDNTRHAERTGLRNSKGIGNAQAKLTDDDVRAIRASSSSERQLAGRFGVARSLIGRIKRREGWQHVN